MGTSDNQAFDYIVVGAGSAGCVLGARLSEDASTRVLVVEAGRRDWSPFIQIPAGIKQIDPSYDWNFKVEPDESRGGIVDTWPAGKVVGGGSSINGMIWVRGQAADYDEWDKLGATGWGFDAVLPYFQRSESYEVPGHRERGYFGPVNVGPVRVQHPTTALFLKAAQSVGHAFNDDYNSGDAIGAAFCQVSQRRGWRRSAGRAYLAPVARRPNVTIRLRSTVDRIVFTDNRATGIEYRNERNQVFRATCTKEVILTAGALASPKLLMLSGIGPEKALRNLGINVIAPSPAVGTNLQEHALAPFLVRVNRQTLNRELNPRGIVKHGLDFVLRGRGAVTSPPTHAIVFMADESGRATIQTFFAPFGVVSPSDGSGYNMHALQMLREFSVTSYACLLHPKSRGTVELRSSRPEDPPLITHAMLGDRADLAGLREAGRRTREIFRSAPFSGLIVEEMKPSRDVETDDEWDEFLRHNAHGGRHPVGTVRMGEDENAPVDPQLRVRGVEGLRVADASVMPTLPGANTNAPTIMIAERAADLVRGRA
jgi:choline dehydrogenase